MLKKEGLDSKRRIIILGLLIFFQLALRQSGASVTLLQTYYSILLLPAIFWALILSLKKISGIFTEREIGKYFGKITENDSN